MSGGGTTSSSSSPPPEFLQGYDQALGQATNVAATPYQPYGGSLVAPLSTQQTAGINQISGAAQNQYGNPVSQPYINQAQQYMQGANQQLLTPDILSYIQGAAGPGVTNAATGAAGGVTNAANAGAQGVLGAAGAGQQGVLGATYGGQQGVTGAAGYGAQNVMGATYGGQAGVQGAAQQGAQGVLGASGLGAMGVMGAAGQAAQGVTGAAQGFDPNAIAPWLSPYTQNVVNSTQAEFNNQNQQAQSQLAGNAASQGAYGGDRSGVAAGVLAGQQQLAQAPVIAGLEQTGYQNAEQQALAASQLQEQAATTAGGYGLTGATTAAQLGQTGATTAAGLGLQGATTSAGLGQTGATTAAGLGLQGATTAAGLGQTGATTAAQLGLTGATTAGGYGLQGATTAGQFGLTGATTQAQLEQQAAQTELGAGEAQNWLSSQTGFGEANLGNEELATQLEAGNAQIAAGGLPQQIQQEELNVPYEQYTAEQAYPFQTTGWLSNIAEGLGSSAGGTSSTTYPAPALGSQALGAGLAGTGILGSTGAFGANGYLTGSNGLFGGASAGGGTWDDAGGAFTQASGGAVPTLKRGGGIAGNGDIHIAQGRALGGVMPRMPRPLRSGIAWHGPTIGRASGGFMPSGVVPTSSPAAGIPIQTGVPDVSMSVVPSGQGSASKSPLWNADQTTTTSGSGASGILGDVLGAASIGAKAASLFAKRGGVIPHRAPGGDLPFMDDDDFSVSSQAPAMAAPPQWATSGLEGSSRRPPAGVPTIASNDARHAGPATMPQPAPWETSGLEGTSRTTSHAPSGPPAPGGGVAGPPAPPPPNGSGPGKDQAATSQVPAGPTSQGVVAADSGSPWKALTYAGLGILGGGSPNAGENIGRGALEGLKLYDTDREREELAADRRQQEANTAAWRQTESDIARQKEGREGTHQLNSESMEAARLQAYIDNIKNEINNRNQPTYQFSPGVNKDTGQPTTMRGITHGPGAGTYEPAPGDYVLPAALKPGETAAAATRVGQHQQTQSAEQQAADIDRTALGLIQSDPTGKLTLPMAREMVRNGRGPAPQGQPAAGGTAAPAAGAPQQLPPPPQATLAQAQAALARHVPLADVQNMMRKLGFDPSGLAAPQP